MTVRSFTRPWPSAFSRPYNILCASLLLLWIASSFANEPIVLENGRFILSDSASIPDQHANWQPQALPDNWNLSRPGAGGLGWYELRFQLPPDAQGPHAIYLPKLSMNVALYVNGHFLADGGSFQEPVARHWNRPLLFSLPPHFLRAGEENTLHIRLRAYPNSRGGLDRIRIGPSGELRKTFELRYFVQTILPQLCNIVVASLGLFMLALWIRRRNESTYVFFFVFSTVWAIRSTHMFVRDIPVPAFAWDIWVQSSFGWCALLFVVLAMRYSGIRWRRFEWILILYALAGPIWMYLAGPARLHVVANNWSFFIVPVAIFFEAFLIRQAWRDRTPTSALLATVWALIIAASIHDGLVHRDRLAFDSFYWVSYVMILLSFVMGWMLTSRFVQALVTAEKLNVELEARVAQKHAELEAHFKRLQDMERANAVVQERNRIMSEMHDGIGSQLIAMIDSVERGATNEAQITQDLRDVMDGLRLTIDSLEPTDNDLLTVLGTLRYRLQGRFNRQGIKLDWNVTHVPPLPSLTPQSVLHILRILQEAFTNVIKHSHAKTVTVRTGVTGAHVCISVNDDGVGVAGHRKGRGLINMERRALALGARLVVDSSPQGTTVRLMIPLDNSLARCGSPAHTSLDTLQH